MQHSNQPDTNYQLVTEAQTTRTGRKWGAKTWISGALAATLLSGALYGPAVWQTGSVSAADRMQEAARLTLDTSLLQDQDALAQLYSTVSPSVVSIQVTSEMSAEDAQGFRLPDIPGFPQLPDGQLPPQQGQGSGFIYDNEGHIVTNNHVVENATKVNVIFSDGHWAAAEVVATDPQADLAVIKVEPPADFTWRPLPIADPASLKVGHMVVAMGTPFGFENTMTTGIVSALGRGMPVGQFGENRYTLPDIIQTDAAINPGNSGGPLVNLAGEVVGVNFAIESGTRSNSGVGFTIPAAIVRRVVPELIKDGKFDYAYLGLSGQTIGPEVAQQLELSDRILGVYVGNVVAGGPSDEAGIKGGDNRTSTRGSNELQPGGDIITAINDQPVHRFEDLVSYLITKANPGETVKLTIIRNGEQSQVDVVLGARPGATEKSQRAQAEGPISARAAIDIAKEAAKELLGDNITQTVVSPDQQNDQKVWVVELSNDSQSAIVTIDQATGEVLQMDVK